MTPREIAIKVAWSYLGTPYLWGGDDFSGFDCSGYVIECLKSGGILPRNGDWKAVGLYHYSTFKTVMVPYEGCLVFWHNKEKTDIIHVEICLDDTFSIGASGGGSKTKSEAAAILHNAYIKIRPFRTRPGIAGFRDPFS
jgi:cell wall-associated NlpC family hydrolase